MGIAHCGAAVRGAALSYLVQAHELEELRVVVAEHVRIVRRPVNSADAKGRRSIAKDTSSAVQ